MRAAGGRGFQRVRYGLVEGTLTVAFVANREDHEDGGHVYLVATPCEPSHPLAKTCRPEGDHLSEADLSLRVRTVRSIVNLKLAPPAGRPGEAPPEPRRWPQERLPALEAVAAMEPEEAASAEEGDAGLRARLERFALTPLSARGRDGESLGYDPAPRRPPEPEEPHGDQPQGQGSRPLSEGDGLALVLGELRAMSTRLSALEEGRGGSRGTNPDQGTGAFGDLVGSASPPPPGLGPLEARILSERPRGLSGARAPAPSLAPSVPRGGPRRDAPGAPAGPEGESEPSDRALLLAALSAMGGRAEGTGQAEERGALGLGRWKSVGAQGQIQQDHLLDALGRKGGPEGVIEEFDGAVARLSHRIGARGEATGRPSMAEVADAWRTNAPLADYRVLARVSECLLHVLGALRSGDSAAAEARVCLLLAGLDQAARDGGRWPRAQLLTCTAEPPFTIYRKAEKVEGGGQGEAGAFCSRERSTVATAVVKELGGSGGR